MESQILKLNEPYEYIYCNGLIGLHIATMIVYEAKVNDEGDYTLETHSHPVVKYYDRPGGTVWNRAELTDCHVLCREDDKRISMYQFYSFLSEMGHLRLSEDSEAFDLGIANISLWKFTLAKNDIKIEWPVFYLENGEKIPQKVFNVALDFKENPKGSKYKYTCSDFDCNNEAAPLFVSFKFNTKEELKAKLQDVIRSYYYMFKYHQFRISFEWPADCEFMDIAEEVNNKEREIRQECDADDDDDV